MNDELGKRMKEQYEHRTRYFLPRRTYTIIRLDGKSFHTYTRGLKRPFDDDLIEDMQHTTIECCKQIEGVRFGYVQSDEISLILSDFLDIKTEAWFDGNLQKIVSVSASIATAHFNELQRKRGIEKVAYFDSRVFTIPDPTEVENYFIWRQADATRNAIQMVAQSLYSHKQLHNKGWSELNEMIFQKGQNFNDYPTYKKRGSLIVKNKVMGIAVNKKTGEEVSVERNVWEIHPNTPIFTSEEGRAFLSSLIPTYSDATDKDKTHKVRKELLKELDDEFGPSSKEAMEAARKLLQ